MPSSVEQASQVPRLLAKGKLVWSSDPRALVKAMQASWRCGFGGGATKPGGQATICVRDLHFSYAEKPILRGISLRAEAGEFIGIIGSNGSGKTTFLSCLTGLDRPNSGEVEVEGIDEGGY